MFARNLLNLTACCVALVGAVVVHPERTLAQASRFCDGYARDYAQRNSRGQLAGGAAMGAIGGAILGGIIGRGGKGAGTGALIGGGVGALAGGAQQSNDYNALYYRAYDNCMRR